MPDEDLTKLMGDQFKILYAELVMTNIGLQEQIKRLGARLAPQPKDDREDQPCVTD